MKLRDSLAGAARKEGKGFWVATALKLLAFGLLLVGAGAVDKIALGILVALGVVLLLLWMISTRK